MVADWFSDQPQYVQIGIGLGLVIVLGLAFALIERISNGNKTIIRHEHGCGCCSAIPLSAALLTAVAWWIRGPLGRYHPVHPCSSTRP